MKEIEEYHKEVVCENFGLFLADQAKYIVENDENVSRREAKNLIWRALKEFMGESIE